MHVQVSAPGLILVIWVFTLVEHRTPEYNAGQVTLTLTAIYYHPSAHSYYPSACNNYPSVHNYYPSARNNHPSLATIIRLLTAIIRLLATIIRLLAMITRLHFKISTASDNTVSPQYAYPAWCHVLGWAITLTSLAALPILAVTEIFRWIVRGN